MERTQIIICVLYITNIFITSQGSYVSKMLPNETFKVASLFYCNSSEQREMFIQNTLWKQTMLGCQLIQLLQEVHEFNFSYVYQKEDTERDVTTEIEMYLNHSAVDFYVRPMSLRIDVLGIANPVGAIFDWNFGFTISHPDVVNRNFYSKPFTRMVWNILYVMALLCSIFFYILKRWENKVKKCGKVFECSYGYELLMVIGAYCQHIPPIEARILSRRTAYFVFFVFAYIVYTYYTSNLLSHLVNDRINSISLGELLESDIECVILENVKAILNNNIISIYSGHNLSTAFQKLLKLRPVSIEEGLAAVKTTKAALLSDYVTLTPYILKEFTSNEICNLAQIDVVSNIKKYLFVSKTFPYYEEFKVSISRIRETGLLNRLVVKYYKGANTECAPLPHVQTQFQQISYPLWLLTGTYAVSILILGIEIMVFRRYRVWSYAN